MVVSPSTTGVDLLPDLPELPDAIEIQPVRSPIEASIRPPGSKSITNRALVCAALAQGTSTLRGALASEDTEVMLESLGRLGLEIEVKDHGKTLVVHGCGGTIPKSGADLWVANSGTTIRFLTALVTLFHGHFRLDGVKRMRERPIRDLIEALVQLGAKVKTENDTGCPPVVVDSDGLPGGVAKIRGAISSQYLSGLLMAAPLARQSVTLNVEGRLVSQPYVRMTQAVMQSFGVHVDCSSLEEIEIPSGVYQPCDYEIEPDASAASYFWAAAAIAGGRVRVEGLSRDSLQGDVAFCNCLARMRCQVEYDRDSITVSGGPLVGIDVDMGEISDTVQTLAVVALFAKGPTRIRNVEHNRHKETDRISDLATELRKLGAGVEEHDDGLTIVPNELRGAMIETYQDHRMAMSMALVGLRRPGVWINDPGCTAKTYPNFFDDLKRLVSA